MSTLTIVSPAIAPAPQAAPGRLVDAPASSRPADVPRPGVVVELSEQVRELTSTEKQDSDERKQRLRGRELTDEQKREVEELKKTDREVRAHEAAHKAAAGAYARGVARFDTVVGPDGRSYAIGGEVSIDTSPVSGDPEATVQKMEQVARAALAPADPSGQDRAVAAQARKAAAEARGEILAERAEERRARDAESAATSDGEDRLDVSSETSKAGGADGAEARSGLASVFGPTPPAGDHASESPVQAALHGHGPGESCPLCTAPGPGESRPRGALDLSA